MFDTKRVKDLVLGTLVTDSYCLGSHWIYDEEQLKNLNTDWENLGRACAIWHKGKMAGEFTHYGDQVDILYQYVLTTDTFDLESYMLVWQKKMQSYNGYVDGATRETLENMEANKPTPYGSDSSDLSIVGRIAPLLLVSSTKEEFLNNVHDFVSGTHNSQAALESSKFFATVLIDVLEGKDIVASIVNRKGEFSTTIQGYIDEGLNSVENDTFETIRNFGPACSIDGGFAGVIHVLAKYTNFKEAMVNNAKAGGDNSARGMIIALLMVAKDTADIIPPAWLNIRVHV